MRARSFVIAVVVLSTVLAGCKGDRGGDVPATSGSLAPGPSTQVPDPLGADGSTTTGVAGAGVTTTLAAGRTTTTRQGATTTTTGASSQVAADPRVAAQGALDGFLNGLQTEDYAAAMRSSYEGPRLLAFVRSLLKTLNSQAGATSTFSYPERRYAPAAVTPDRVVFTGRAVLKQTTVTKTGERKTAQVVLGEVAVVLRSDRWLVAELVWEGKPVEYTPSTARADVGSGVTARLAGAVRFGGTAAVVVGFQTDKDLAIRIEKDRLRGAGYDDASTFRALVSGYAYFNYPRKAAPPKTWTAQVTVNPDKTRAVSMAFG